MMLGVLAAAIRRAIAEAPTEAGITWTARTSAADNGWYSVCWSPERSLLVANGYSGTGNRVMTSPDGITWTARTSAADNVWQAMCWSPERGLFVAVAGSGTGNRVMTSPDGITWTIRTSAADNSWRSVCWSPERGLFVAVAVSGTGSRVMTSPDGITWTARTSPTNSWISVCWSPERGLFVAVAVDGAGNRVMTSSDGITWTSGASAADNQWFAVCWSPERGLFVAVAANGAGNRVMTSPDGINWTIRASAADNQWHSVCWSPEQGLFVAVAINGTGNRVMTSPDGINWTIRASAADNSWRSVCWSPGLNMFVAVSDTGTGNRVMTSGVTPPTTNLWTPLDMSTAPQVYLDAHDSVVTDVSGYASAISNLGAMGADGNFVQATAANRPAIVANELNGKRVLRFDGADDRLIGGSVAQRDLTRNKSAVWVYAVVKKRTADSPAAQRVVFSASIGTAVGSRMQAVAGLASAGNMPGLGARRLDGGVFNNVLAPTAKAGNYYLAAFEVDYSTRVGRVYIDGALSAEDTALIDSAGSTSDTASQEPLVVGAFASQALGFADIDLAALVVGNAALPALDRQKLEGWAAHKYGLTASLPAGHPYKIAAPIRTVPPATGEPSNRPVLSGYSDRYAVSASMNAPLPAGWAAGDLCVLAIAATDSSFINITGWNSFGRVGSPGNTVYLTVLHKVLASGDAPVVPAGAVRIAGCAVFKAGTFDVASPIQSVVSAALSSVSPSTPEKTTTLGDGEHYQLQLAAFTGGATVTGYPLIEPNQAKAISSTCLAASGGALDGSTAPQSAFALSASSPWVSWKVAVKGLTMSSDPL